VTSATTARSLGGLRQPEDAKLLVKRECQLSPSLDCLPEDRRGPCPGSDQPLVCCVRPRAEHHESRAGVATPLSSIAQVDAELLRYWDWRTKAVSVGGDDLRSLSEADRIGRCRQESVTIQQKTAVLSNEDLLRSAVTVADDLYRSVFAVGAVDEPIGLYLQATAGTFFAVLTSRGYSLNYVVDNTFRSDDAGSHDVLEVLPAWYAAAQMVYICPWAVCQGLMANDFSVAATKGSFAELLPRYISEGRHVASMIVTQCREQTQHFVFLDPDSEKASLDEALAMSGKPGVLTVFRNEAPIGDSTVRVWYPPMT
jgi:hypothetical protein